MKTKRTDTLRRVLATASFAVALMTGSTLAGCRQREIPPQVGQMIQSTVKAETVPASIRDQKERARAWSEMRHFYETRQFQPAWLTAQGLRRRELRHRLTLDRARMGPGRATSL